MARHHDARCGFWPAPDLVRSWAKGFFGTDDRLCSVHFGRRLSGAQIPAATPDSPQSEKDAYQCATSSEIGGAGEMSVGSMRRVDSVPNDVCATLKAENAGSARFCALAARICAITLAGSAKMGANRQAYALLNGLGLLMSGTAPGGEQLKLTGISTFK